LSEAEANKVIIVLKDMMKYKNHIAPLKKEKSSPVEVPGMVTIGQQKKIWYLMYQIEKCDKTKSKASLGDRLCGIIKRQLHIDAISQAPFKFINFKNGNQLIEILKKYVASAQGKAQRSDVS
jgi:hypothetical protein